MFNKNINRYANKDCAYRFTPCSKLQCLRFVPEHIFSEDKYFPIHGKYFPVPSGFDEELRQQYGDYMRPHKDDNIYIKHLIEM